MPFVDLLNGYFGGGPTPGPQGGDLGQQWQGLLQAQMDPDEQKRQRIRSFLANMGATMATTPGDALTGLTTGITKGAQGYHTEADKQNQLNLRNMKDAAVWDAANKARNRRLAVLESGDARAERRDTRDATRHGWEGERHSYDVATRLPAEEALESKRTQNQLGQEQLRAAKNTNVFNENMNPIKIAGEVARQGYLDEENTRAWQKHEREALRQSIMNNDTKERLKIHMDKAEKEAQKHRRKVEGVAGTAFDQKVYEDKKIEIVERLYSDFVEDIRKARYGNMSDEDRNDANTYREALFRRFGIKDPAKTPPKGVKIIDVRESPKVKKAP